MKSFLYELWPTITSFVLAGILGHYLEWHWGIILGTGTILGVVTNAAWFGYRVYRYLK